MPILPHLYLTTHVTSSVHVTFWGSQKLRNSRARLQKLSGAQNNVIYHLSKNPKILSEIDSKRFNPLRSARAHVFVHALMSRKIVRGRDAQCNTEESLNVIRLTQTVALQHNTYLFYCLLSRNHLTLLYTVRWYIDRCES